MSVQERLEAYLARHGAVAGSAHRLRDGVLQLEAAVNLPPAVRRVSAVVPRGKGMAGLAWERGVAVQTCDLQTDQTGDVRPGAKAVQAGAAVALPVGEPIRGVVGAAFARTGELTPAELAGLSAEAAAVLG